ncbi:hypothetical protein I316_03063 [Kwoniella heveanensis BCC8398]|uniref:DUF6699 domain-containing protein n=1 Tax=Kwoniella heveanensis BCC8398 TaxID=1296120 RepID=A0A1B9GVH3_9TREE|nr:hypothetical protein I316_03063 [Kwoniella heveanensis BCC8398]
MDDREKSRAMSIVPQGAPRDAAITIGPFKPSRPGYGPVLSYLQAAQLETPLKIHPLLNLRTWDPKPYAKYLAWNVIEHPMFAAIWVDYDGIKERGQPATSPIVEELNIGHVETGWSIRVRNRMGITCEDVLFAIIRGRTGRNASKSSKNYFEKRRMGFFDLMEGYRKSDALLGATYFDG